MLLATAGTGFVINSMLPAPVLDFMLLGLAYFTAIANMVTEEQLNGIMKVMNPVIGFAMIVVILNLGAPLDYHLIFGAGIYTAVYIISRAVGKYSGAYFGAAITHAPVTVKKIFRIYLAAAFRRVFGIYRNRCVRAVRCCPGMRVYHPGNDCGRGSD